LGSVGRPDVDPPEQAEGPPNCQASLEA
jgi:hypothetical protein